MNKIITYILLFEILNSLLPILIDLIEKGSEVHDVALKRDLLSLELGYSLTKGSIEKLGNSCLNKWGKKKSNA